MADVPAELTTRTSTDPAVAAGAVTTMVVSFETVNEVAGTLPNRTEEAPVK